VPGPSSSARQDPRRSRPYNAAGIGCTGPILLALLVYAVASGEAVVAVSIFALTMGVLMLTV
jgi:hypothetical protein